MDRKRNSEKQQPQEHPIEPEMPKGVEENDSDPPAGDPAKQKRVDEL